MRHSRDSWGIPASPAENPCSGTISSDDFLPATSHPGRIVVLDRRPRTLPMNRIFFNEAENRPRAGWRIALFFVALAAIGNAIIFGITALLGSRPAPGLGHDGFWMIQHTLNGPGR